MGGAIMAVSRSRKAQPHHYSFSGFSGSGLSGSRNREKPGKPRTTAGRAATHDRRWPHVAVHELRDDTSIDRRESMLTTTTIGRPNELGHHDTALPANVYAVS